MTLNAQYVANSLISGRQGIRTAIWLLRLNLVRLAALTKNKMSKYSIQVEQNSWGGSEEVRPLTEDAAYDWLEAIGEVEMLEKYFSDQVKDA